MDIILVGGLCHGEIESVPEGYSLPNTLQITMAQDLEEMKELSVLSKVGIAPPIGSHMLLYARLGDYEDPAVYIFIAETEHEVQAED